MNAMNTNLDGLPFMGRAVATIVEPRLCRGIARGTLIVAEDGMRAIETLKVGDSVRTFDNGWQPIVAIRRTLLTPDLQDDADTPTPFTIPAGTLGNVRAITVMPDQGLMVGSENACDVMGDPFAVVPVQALEGQCGITRSAPARQTELFVLVFASEEVVYSDGGQLLHCDCQSPGGTCVCYDVKSVSEAREMLTDLDLAELVLEDERNEVLSRGRMARVA